MGATAMVGMGLATAPWALLVDMVAMQGQAPMWPPILVRSTLQRGQLSQRRNPNMQLATLAGWVWAWARWLLFPGIHCAYLLYLGLHRLHRGIWALQRIWRLQWTLQRRLLRLNKDSIVHIEYSFIKK